MGLLPPAWCGPDPRACAKAFAIVELVFSLIGLVILICLPIIVLNFHDEVLYIKQYRESKSNKESAAAIKEENWFYVLKTPFTLDGLFFCESYKQAVHAWLGAFLNPKKDKPPNQKDIKFTVSQNNSRMESYDDGKKHRTYCVIDVYTPEDPSRDIVKSEGIIYSMRKIVSLCLTNRTDINLTQENLEKEMKIIPPEVSESYQIISYPGTYNDPAKITCIDKYMAEADAKETETAFYSMYGLLLTATLSSTILSFFILGTSASNVSREYLFATFALQGIPILLLVAAVLHSVNPILCLLEYSGISPNGQASPPYIRTGIAYTSGVYIAVFKGYLLWFLVTYAANLSSIKERRKRELKKQAAAAPVVVSQPSITETEGTVDIDKFIAINESKPGPSAAVGKRASVNNNKPSPKAPNVAKVPSTTTDAASGSDEDETAVDGEDDEVGEDGLLDLFAMTKKKRISMSRSRAANSKNNRGTLGLGRFGNKFW